MSNLISKQYSKILSIQTEYTSECAVVIYKFFNKVKIKHKVLQPLLNKKFCKLFDIKTLLIVRFDGIGDFLLTRPFFKSIKNSEKFKNYKIIFAGKPEFVDLAKKYDGEYIDYFISENLENPLWKKHFLKLAKHSYVDYIINPCDHKCNTHLEDFISTIDAKNKICHMGFFAHDELINHKNKVKESVYKKYTKVIDTGKEPVFVLDKNKLFFEKILNEKILETPDLDDLDNIINDIITINFDYVTVSPFSRSKKRTYSPENFSKIINFINQDLNLPVFILGSSSEKEDGEYIRSLCTKSEMVYNLAGKLSINESVILIKNSKMLIANETGTVHIAKNFQTKTLCISNGSYMSTFQPYSEDFMYYIYPDNINQILSDCNGIGHLIDYDINNIDSNKVIDKIKDILV